MKKLDLHYKLTKLKWQIRTLKNKISFRSFLFMYRVRRIFIRKDTESEYPHLYYNNIDSYKIGNHKCAENSELFNFGGFKPDELLMIYGRLTK